MSKDFDFLAEAMRDAGGPDKKTSLTGLAGALGKMFGAFFISAPICVAASGITISQMWQWFAVGPLGLPPIGIVVAASFGRSRRSRALRATPLTRGSFRSL